MNALVRAAYRFTIRLGQASLDNHTPVTTTEGVTCSQCRPIEEWPCRRRISLEQSLTECRARLGADA